MNGYLKQSTASQVRTIGPFVDDSDFKTLENALSIANTDIKIKKNGATSGNKNSGGATADGSAGLYHLTWDATDTDTVGELYGSVKVAGALVVFFSYTVLEEAVYDMLFGASAIGYITDQPVNVTKWLGTAAATPTVAGVPEVDVTHFNGTAGTFSSGRPEVNTSHAAGTAWNSGAIGAATLAADTITAAKVATDVTTKLRALASGTSDSGSTTTMVDAARTEADTDYWAGDIILFTSGNISGQARVITAFNASTDTITFTPATTQAVATQTYEILPGARAILAGITHTSAVIPSVTTTDTATAVTTVNGLAANVITATSINADAITAAKIANGAIDAATFAAGAIDATAIATDAITSAKIAADAIGSSELAASAVDEIWAKAMTELSAVPGVTGTVLDALEWIFLLARNKITQTATTQLLRNDADAATIGTSTLSDDGTTFIRGEFA